MSSRNRLENLADAYLEFDIDGNVTYVNEATCVLLGYPKDELLNLHYSNLVDPEQVQRLRRVLGCLYTTGKPVKKHPAGFLRKNGEKRFAEDSISLITHVSGRPVGCRCIRRDVTDEKKTIDQLILGGNKAWQKLRVLEREIKRARQNAERADKASAAKSQFLANISHEIRTPLNGILGFSTLLLEDELTKEQREAVETIKMSGENLLNLVNDILDITKVEKSKLEIETLPFNLKTVIFDAIESLKADIEAKKLAVRWIIDSKVPNDLLGDPKRLRQVIINLVGNAVKFTEKGKIEVEVGGSDGQRSAADPDSIELLFSVKDTGMGIPKEKFDIVFESFEQLNPGAVQKYTGTGLGLTISRKLTRLMGGRIWVESTPGAGSTFFFTAKFKKNPHPPRNAPPDPAGSSKKNDKQITSPLRILFVEDNPVNLMLGCKMFHHMGYTSVEIAKTGLEALQRVKRNKPYDIIFMDIQMPEMDGVEAAKRIRTETAARQVPIVALTANAMKGDREHYIEAGMDDYLSKPVRREDIQRMIIKWVSSAGTQVDVPDEIRVLIVEDDENMRKSMMRILKRRMPTVKILSAVDGIDATAKLGSFMPDLILLDIMMPRMNGIEFIQYVRDTERYARCRIVVSTALHKDDPKLSQAQKIGVQNILFKPFRDDGLIRAITSALKPDNPDPHLVEH